MTLGYTTIEQSKHLVELGLDPRTADMFYATEMGIIIAESPYGVEGHEPCIPFTPAWSLTALLELMPKIKATTPILVKTLLEEKYYCIYQGIGSYKEVNKTSFQDKPVDAAFEMVCWLKTNKII